MLRALPLLKTWPRGWLALDSPAPAGAGFRQVPFSRPGGQLVRRGSGVRTDAQTPSLAAAAASRSAGTSP